MSELTDAELSFRGADTLVASWEQYAQEATAGAVVRAPGVAIAAFPNEPERTVYNNALFERGLTSAERADAVDAMEAAYAQVGITSFAAWVHESDAPTRGGLEQRGYTVAESTRAMALRLDELRLARPEVDVAPADWSEHLRVGDLPAELLSAGDHAAFHILVARLRRRERRHRHRLRSGHRLRHLQRGHARARPPPWARHCTDRGPPLRRDRPWLPYGEPAIDADG